MLKSILLATALMAAAPAFAADLPPCSAKVKDSCQQTTGQEARAMSAAQADKRDAAHGGTWASDLAGQPKADTMAMHKRSMHKKHAMKADAMKADAMAAEAKK